MKQCRFFVLFSVFAAASCTLAAQTNSGDSSMPASIPPAIVPPKVDQPPKDAILEYHPSPAEYARAKAYSNTRYRHFFVNTLYGFLLLLILLRWRLAPALRDLAEQVSPRRFVQLIIFAPLILLTIAVLGIPSDIWDQSLDRAFGLSVQPWPAWYGDWITNQIITLILGTVLVGILYAIIRRSPHRWWFYFWLASLPVLLAVFFLKPLVVDPLFYTFKPLAGAEPALVSEIQKVTGRGGIAIPANRMFVMNASAKTTELDAYVTGFGASKRVVVWDTMIAKATTPETLFVFGHEMGHYVLLHLAKGIVCAETILLFLLYLGYRLALWMLARWKTQWGIRDLGDWASFPALFFLLSLLAFLATPAFNAVSRYFEHEADRYGLEVTHGIVTNPNQVAAHFFEKSGEVNLSDPDPNWFVKLWFYDHPTRPERIHFVATYDPWSQGQEPKYVK
jgi:STE24 endopeptidase